MSKIEEVDKKIQYSIYLLAAGIAVAFGALAYAHANFVTKDVFSLVLSKLDKIEAKLDRISK